MRPSYWCHSSPVFLPKPSLTQALIHSLRKFFVSNTGPSLRKSFLSIPVSSLDKGRMSGLRFLTTPGGRCISFLSSLTQGHTFVSWLPCGIRSRSRRLKRRGGWPASRRGASRTQVARRTPHGDRTLCSSGSRGCTRLCPHVGRG